MVERDEGAEARQFETVVSVLDQITPRIEITRPGRCGFATLGPSRYFGGDEALAAKTVKIVTEALADGEGEVRVGIADGAFAAELAARQTQPEDSLVVPVGESSSFLAPWPIEVLRDEDLIDVVVRLGLRTLSDFAKLELADVVGRFGASGMAAYQMACGQDVRQLDVGDPPVDMGISLELDPPVERVDQAAFVAKAAADELHERLNSHGAACTRVLIGAETEHGEVRERLWRHEGALTSVAIAQRIRWQLDGWLNGPVAARPTGGLALIYLRPDEIGPAVGRQLGFWGGQSAGNDRAAKAVARIHGLLGPGAVLVAEPAGGRQPHDQLALVAIDGTELADHVEEFDRSKLSHPSQGLWPGQLGRPSPIVVHHEPIPAQVHDAEQRPVQVNGRGEATAPPCWVAVGARPNSWLEVIKWAGPWPLDERWWDSERARRRARFQVLTNDGKARLLGLEGGQWWVDAAYE